MTEPPLDRNRVRLHVILPPDDPPAPAAGPSDAAPAIRDLIHGAEEVGEDSAGRLAEHGGGPGDRPLPRIRIAAGEMSRVVDDVSAALRERPGDLYQRSGVIVYPAGVELAASAGRVTRAARILPATEPLIRETITRAATIMQFDARRQTEVQADCPAVVAATLMARGDYSYLRVLRGVVAAPIVRLDGSIVTAAGYDEATGLLLDDPGGMFVAWAPAPASPAAALEAAAVLGELLDGFPFVAGVDRAAAYAALLTPLVRPVLSAAPAIGVTAPAAGSGKSLLVDLASILATGRPAPVISYGADEIEFEKRLAAELLAGASIIAIDNVEQPLGGPLLCQVLTQSLLRLRVLGQSLTLEVPATAAIFATGNNLALVGDVTRRVLLCRLDAQIERPELRQFSRDPVDMLGRDRARYVGAALTLLHARAASDAPRPVPLASFGRWSRLVRDALLYAGLADVVDAIQTARGSDPALLALRAVIGQWCTAVGERTVTVAEIIDHAAERDGDHHWARPDLRAALLAVAADRAGAVVNPLRLAKFLARHRDRVVDGLRLRRTGNDRTGVACWQIEVVEGES